MRTHFSLHTPLWSKGCHLGVFLAGVHTPSVPKLLQQHPKKKKKKEKKYFPFAAFAPGTPDQCANITKWTMVLELILGQQNPDPQKGHNRKRSQILARSRLIFRFQPEARDRFLLYLFECWMKSSTLIVDKTRWRRASQFFAIGHDYPTGDQWRVPWLWHINLLRG